MGLHPRVNHINTTEHLKIIIVANDSILSILEIKIKSFINYSETRQLNVFSFKVSFKKQGPDGEICRMKMFQQEQISDQNP